MNIHNVKRLRHLMKISSRLYSSNTNKETIPRNPTILDDATKRLLNDFKTEYPSLNRITKKTQLDYLISVNDEIRDWYLSWKRVTNFETTKPSFLSDSKEDMQAWENLKIEREELRKYNKNWNTIENEAADTFKKVLKKIRIERKEYYNTLKPLHLISMLSVRHLDKDKLLEIALEPRERERSDLVKKEITLLQTTKYKEYLKTGIFSNPFCEEGEVE